MTGNARHGDVHAPVFGYNFLPDRAAALPSDLNQLSLLAVSDQI